MYYYHYGPSSILTPVKRLGGRKGWEFLESEQNQSEGKPKACYLTRLSHVDLADNSKPVARVLGLKATSGDCWLCFQMNLPDDWSTSNDGPIRIMPIRGDRGRDGIALYMVKKSSYADSLDNGVDARDDYIYINREYCDGIYKISTGTGKGKSLSGLRD
jgi:hypothetical protein